MSIWHFSDRVIQLSVLNVSALLFCVAASQEPARPLKSLKQIVFCPPTQIYTLHKNMEILNSVSHKNVGLLVETNWPFQLQLVCIYSISQHIYNKYQYTIPNCGRFYVAASHRAEHIHTKAFKWFNNIHIYSSSMEKQVNAL